MVGVLPGDVLDGAALDDALRQHFGLDGGET